MIHITRYTPELTTSDGLVARADQKWLAAMMKAARLRLNIGSKYLRVVMAETHANVNEWSDFVHDVEYNRILITPELEQFWRETLLKIHYERVENRVPLRECPCDYCGKSTGNWLYDICGNCMRQQFAATRVQ